jgi:hypothetical protein
MNETTLNNLYAPMAKKERQGPGGKMYAYTPSQDVIDRMNKTFKGNWSTNVTHQEIVEDQVLIRVTVTACDPEGTDGYSYSHDGFGSSLIARYSYGDNKGKAMDIGNIFKSAEAKAIVNACKRFGVALLDEEQEIPSEVKIPDGFMGHETAPAPAPESTQTTGVLDMSKVAEMKASMTSAPEKTEPEAPVMPVMDIPVPPTPSPETINTTPPIEFAAPAPETGPPSETLFTKADDVQQQPVAPAGHLEPNEPGTISDVQLIVITGFFRDRGFNYQELAQSSFTQAGLPIDAIPEPEDLSYNQAVIIIKYGNDKQRQNM